MRRKYQFRDRATAESEYRKENRRRLHAEWLLTAIVNKKAVQVGRASGYTVGYVMLPYSVIVYSIQPGKSIHCVHAIWDVDDNQLREHIAEQVRYPDTHAHGELLERARAEAYKAYMAS